MQSLRDIYLATKTLIVSDFDGTISTADVGFEIIKKFASGEWEEIDRAYCEGKIGSKDAYTQIAALINASRDEMVAYALRYGRIDPHFKEFYRFCTHNHLDLTIVSDGLDFYIDAILRKNGIGDITYFANRVRFSDNKICIEFPQSNDLCEKCGTCKSKIIEHYRLTYENIIYIGNGYSDICPAQVADVLFAKDILYDTCVKNGRDCIRYDHFGDIRNSMK